MGKTILEMIDIKKSFSGIYALSGINFSLEMGEVHALLGENGAGKSTLIKVLGGIYKPDSGTIKINGQEVEINGVSDAQEKGIGIIHQEIVLVPYLTVAQNLFLGREIKTKFGTVDMRETNRRAGEMLANLGVNIHPDTLVESLTIAQQQMVEIIRAVSNNARVLIMDEPTANLDAGAIDTLRQQIIQIKKEGRTVVIAEHRLYFLMDLIDRAIFIQKGKIVQIFSGNEFRNLSDEQRIRMGLRSLVQPVLELPPADPSGAQEGLSVENLSCAFDKQPVFSGLGFSAKRGEVLGIVGHNGAGKTTMTRCLCGLLKEVNGTVRLDGQTLKAKQRNKASFCVMQDVNHQLFSDSVWNECELAQPDCPPERIEEILRSFDLLDFKDRHPMALSGGQKQRLAVATAILSNKDVLVFDEPTSGLDYHRMLEVSNMIRKLNDENKVIIIVSHDFEFLGRTCDKIFNMEGCSIERR
mgnify:CR=1 FL=1